VIQEATEFSFDYCTADENTVFDGVSVFMVCPPVRPGATGETRYRLALMPTPLYTEVK
jgi:hypothetical protein